MCPNADNEIYNFWYIVRIIYHGYMIVVNINFV